MLPLEGIFMQRKQLIEQCNNVFFCIYARVQNLDIPFDLLLGFSTTRLHRYYAMGTRFGTMKIVLPLNKFTLHFSERLHKQDKVLLHICFIETGRYPLHITITVRMVTFWLSLKSGKKASYVFKV